MITQLRAYELAEIVCESYELSNADISVHQMITTGRIGKKKGRYYCSVSAFAETVTKNRIRVGSGLCENYELAIRNFELSVAKETGTDYQRCAEFYVNYESDNF